MRDAGCEQKFLIMVKTFGGKVFENIRMMPFWKTMYKFNQMSQKSHIVCYIVSFTRGWPTAPVRQSTRVSVVEAPSKKRGIHMKLYRQESVWSQMRSAWASKFGNDILLFAIAFMVYSTLHDGLHQPRLSQL